MENYDVRAIEMKVLNGEQLEIEELEILLEDEYDMNVYDYYDDGTQVCESIVDIVDDNGEKHYFRTSYIWNSVWGREIQDTTLNEVFFTPVVRYEWKTKSEVENMSDLNKEVGDLVRLREGGILC